MLGAVCVYTLCELAEVLLHGNILVTSQYIPQSSVLCHVATNVELQKMLPHHVVLVLRLVLLLPCVFDFLVS